MDTTTTTRVTVTAPAEAECAVGTIALAFSADPAARWSYPDPPRYLTHSPAVIRVPAERQGQLGRYHPREPHWYLPLIGVDPLHRGKGHSSALLQHALRRCDGDGAPAYLESTNPANIPLHERHGFRVLAAIQVGSSPPIFPMLRAAGRTSSGHAPAAGGGRSDGATAIAP